MRERRLVSVGRRDGDCQAVSRDLPGERDFARRRRAHLSCSFERDVDSAMLPGCVRVVAQRELAQHRPVGGPRPTEGSGRANKSTRHDRGKCLQKSCCL
jgi:hypothetical protein